MKMPSIVFNTDINMKGQHKHHYPKTYTLEKMKSIAIDLNANVIVETSSGTWYVKNKGLVCDIDILIDKLSMSEKISVKHKSKTYVIIN